MEPLLKKGTKLRLVVTKATLQCVVDVLLKLGTLPNAIKNQRLVMFSFLLSYIITLETFHEYIRTYRQR